MSRIAGAGLSLLLALAAAAPAHGAESVPLSAHDLPIARDALSMADRGQWNEAEGLAASAESPLPLKLVEWLDFQRSPAAHSFEQIAQFIDANPDWPLISVLRVRAESVAEQSPDATVGPFLERHKPITPAARLRLADIEAAEGRTGAADDALRAVWIDGDFSAEDEARLLADHASQLRAEDHIARLDRLLWDGKAADARRMLGRVPADWRLLAEARLDLAAGARTAEAAVAKVPKTLAGDPGLAFARMRWQRHRDMDDAAAGIIEQQQELGRPEAWWPDRQAVARRLLELNEAPRAYRLVADHHAHEPGVVADAEFMAGWIALRYLKDAGRALPHFTQLYSMAKLPVTLARAGYWAGRAEDALGHADAATSWYAKAAVFQTTYYGQLAAAMPGVAAPDRPVPEPKATPAELAAYNQRELVRVVRILMALDQQDRLKPFLGRLAELAQSPAEFAAAADLADEIGRPDLGVAIAKKAFYAGFSLLRAGYPVIWMPRNAGTEQALLLALTRQESAFDVRAVSPSGARGLMQLMPGTAKDVAKSLDLPFSVDQLTRDGSYNVTLGQAYFDTLLAGFNGSYVLSIAGYNAGPGRVQQWIGQFGDPRQPDVDPVDWVESIPYTETRNYVQRVLENLQVYRLRIGDRSMAFSLGADLKR